MNKRHFLKNLGLASAATLVAPSFLSSCSSEKEDEFKIWCWINGNQENSAEDWRREFERLSAAGVTGVLIGGGRQILERSVPAAKELGMTVHAWLWTLNRPGDKDAQAHPEWYAVSRNGESSLEVNPYVGYYQWLCPSKPEVQEYIINFMTSHCDIEGIEAIHLDYVRYCDVILPKGLWAKYDLIQNEELPEYDFCYCDTCRSNFKEVNGYDPLDLEDPSQDEKWRQYRWDSVTNLVNKIAEAVHDRDRLLSAAVFPYPDLARKLVRQSWDNWNLDKVFPMIYHNFYEEDIPWIEFATKQGVNAIDPSIPLYTGLYLPETKPDQMNAAIAAAKSGGAKGVSFFSNGSLDQERISQLEKA